MYYPHCVSAAIYIFFYYIYKKNSYEEGNDLISTTVDRSEDFRCHPVVLVTDKILYYSYLLFDWDDRV